ncbi:DUF262 domain-containing protein [Flavobacterium sp. RNTU_13]|uniref:GmrSD restriction endonuclease domain-containing protein n=1 Tax=Flavobacterium sp. RNTU_13 TaxID=3375145 RepID=UPI003987DB27
MSNNIHNASFYDLMSKYEIEIPIIQRDYVQGREENKKIRHKIISKFKNATSENPTKLDFIYGNIQGNTFYPLDGQQRLTTLFLYYTYFAIRDKELVNSEVKELFNRFTYSTRTSSKEFFKRLLDSNLTIKADTDISKEITNQNWFIDYWTNDPTVSAALSMLTEIHLQCFNDVINFKTLFSEENKNITFEFLELEKFGLSDDLYIKMNARGKILSSYENFKADLIEHIRKNSWETNKPYNDLFATRLDGKWTDYFWDEGNNSKTFDAFFINFFRQFLITEVATRNELSDRIIKKLTSSDNETQPKANITPIDILSKLLNYSVEIDEKYLDEESFNTIYSLLDKYALASKSLKPNFILWNADEKVIDDLLLSDRITYPNRVLHYAHSCYLINNDVLNNVEYNKWIRVVRNIIANATIDTVDTLRGALNLVKEIARGSGYIHEYLSKNTIKSRFAEKQVKEEIEKSMLIVNGLLSYDDLADIEDTRLCSGRAEFVLNFVTKRAGSDYSKVAAISGLFKKYFSENDFTDNVRALFLTSRDGKFYDYWGSWVYIANLPKRCLIEGTNDLRGYSYNQYFREYFEDVIEKLLEKDDIDYHLSQFINNNDYDQVPKWKRKIIENPKLLDIHCKSKMIAVADDDSKCYLMNVGRPRYMDSLKKI